MKNEKYFTAFVLMQEKESLNAGVARLKLLGPGHYESTEYNESFLNIDIAQGLVFWNEKDIAYRRSLIYELSNKTWNRGGSIQYALASLCTNAAIEITGSK